MFQVVGDSTDVIFMTMGDDHAADPLLVLPQKGGVRQHNIHAVHPFGGEGESAIHQHQIIAVFEDAGVLADLMQTAEGNHPKTRLLSLG